MDNKSPEPKITRIIRLPSVMAATGLTRSALYTLMKDGLFPKQVPLGKRAVGWVEAEVQFWLNERIANSRTKATPSQRIWG